MRYPTPEEILSAPVEFRSGAIVTVSEWKRKHFDHQWKNFSNEIKFHWIKLLLEELSVTYQDRVKAPNIQASNRSEYDNTTHTIGIVLDKPSIISALHEFAHHLYGSSEFKACRWSVWLFKSCFPQESLKLKFKGHLLVK